MRRLNCAASFSTTALALAAVCGFAAWASAGCTADSPDASAQNTRDAGKDASTKDSSAKDTSHRDDGVEEEWDAPEPDDSAVRVDAPGNCNETNCAGCCSAAKRCFDGLTPTRCGSRGETCVDCTTFDSTCEPTGVCCEPVCLGKVCGASNDCGGTCLAGSGCCPPQCSGKLCGASDECGGTCVAGSGCCTPMCGASVCGAPDGCGGTCPGSCEPRFFCTDQNACVCGPAPDFGAIWDGNCLPSCTRWLQDMGAIPAGTAAVCCPSQCFTQGWWASGFAYDCMGACCVPRVGGWPTCVGG